MNPQTIRVLLVDDHYVVRVGLLGILNLQPGFTVVGEAETGAEAIDLFRRHRPDITLMDLRMPDVSGVEATTLIRSEFPQARIIVLTTYDQEEDIFRALQAGAQGYVSKRVLGRELLKAIQLVHAGQTYIPEEVARRISERENRSDLTQREAEVLQYMVKGLSNKEIGNLMGFTRFTAKFHVQNILRKLGVSDRTQAVSVAIERGIIRMD